jgi:serine protease Do
MQTCVVQLHVQRAAQDLAASKAKADRVDELIRRFMPRRETRASLDRPFGLGLIWSDSRHVLSLGHVLGDDEALFIGVQADGGQRVAAESLGLDPISGAWLLRLREPLPHAPCRFGSAKGLQVGQELLGIGNLMTLERSLQRGIVSGLGREPDDFGRDLGEPLIQTDFRSARGMAGGPLFDLQGRVVGVHDMMMVTQGGQDLAALARPIDGLLLGAQALKQGQARRPSRLGLQMDDSLGDPDVEQAGQRWLAGATMGVRVRDVSPDGPAARAGLRAGDRILTLNGVRVDLPAALARMVARLPAGQSVALALQREGRTMELTLIPEASPAP